LEALFEKEIGWIDCCDEEKAFFVLGVAVDFFLDEFKKWVGVVVDDLPYGECCAVVELFVGCHVFFCGV